MQDIANRNIHYYDSFYYVGPRRELMIVYFRKLLKAIGAVVILLSFGGPAFPQTDKISTAIAELSNLDKEVRLEALYTLYTLTKANNDERAVEPMIVALNDPDDYIRERAANLLGFRKEERAVNALIRSLKDNNAAVSYSAAEALGNIGDPIAAVPLIEYLNNNPKSHGGTCNYAAIRALGKMHDERAVRPLFSRLPDGCGSEIAEAMGPEAVEQISAIVKQGSESERDSAVWLLGYIADERSLPVLISVLGETKNESRIGFMAANAIARRIGAAAIDPLRCAFKKGDMETKKSAASSLAQIVDERIGAVLVELVTDSDVNIRREVVNILTGMVNSYREGYIAYLEPKNQDVIVSAILTAMHDKDTSIRILAIRSLAWVQRDDVFQALISAMSDPATSAEASIAVGNRKDVRALPYLLKTMTGDDPVLAANASYALVVIREPAVDGLIAVLIDKNKEIPRREIRRREGQARQSADFPFVFRCGNEPPPPVLDPRVLAAGALGQIKDERARTPLTNALKDKAEWLRQAASFALEQLDK